MEASLLSSDACLGSSHFATNNGHHEASLRLLAQRLSRKARARLRQEAKFLYHRRLLTEGFSPQGEVQLRDRSENVPGACGWVLAHVSQGRAGLTGGSG